MAISRPQDVFLVIGQSNAVGRDVLETYTAAPTGAGVFLSTWEQLADPYHGDDAGGPGASFTPKFAYWWLAKTGRLCGFAPAAKGATGFHQALGSDPWDNEEGVAYLAAIDRAEACEGPFKGVIVWGGENDIYSSITRATEVTAIQTMITNFRTDLSAATLHFYFVLPWEEFDATEKTTEQNEAVRNAIRDVVALDANTSIIGDAKNLSNMLASIPHVDKAGMDRLAKTMAYNVWNTTETLPGGYKTYVFDTIDKSTIPVSGTYPKFVDLSKLPDEFWAAVSSDGTDILITDWRNNLVTKWDIPLIDKVNKKGILVYEAVYSTTQNAKYKIWYGYSGNTITSLDGVYGDWCVFAMPMCTDPSSALIDRTMINAGVTSVNGGMDSDNVVADTQTVKKITFATGEGMNLANQQPQLRLQRDSTVLIIGSFASTGMALTMIAGNNFQLGGWLLLIEGGKIGAYFGSNGVGSYVLGSTTLTADQQSMIGFRWDQSEKYAEILLNETIDKTGTTTTAIGADGGETFKISSDPRYPDDVYYPVNGAISTVLAFNKKLTDNEIKLFRRLILSTDLYTIGAEQMAYTETLNASQDTSATILQMRYSAAVLWQANKFVSTIAGDISKVSLKLIKIGTPTGNVWAAIYTNNAGVPGTLIATSDLVDVSTVDTSANFVDFVFSETCNLDLGQTYWIRYDGDYDLSTDNHTGWRIGNTGATFGYYNGTAFSTPYSDADAVYKVYTKVAAITFNSNGGSAVDTQNVGVGELVVEPDDPTK
jgi:hypothetical protein